MKYLAAYALLTLGGKKDITAKDIKEVLGSVSASASDDDINRVVASLKGKTVHQIMNEGNNKIGGGSAPAPAAKPAKEAKEAKKEEPKKKQQNKVEAPKEEEEDFGLGGGLFD